MPKIGRKCPSFWIPLLAGWVAFATPAPSLARGPGPASEVTGCLSLAPARRGVAAGCRARVSLEDGTPLCLEATLWERVLWLETTGYGVCGSWAGKWKVGGAPVNEPGVSKLPRELFLARAFSPEPRACSKPSCRARSWLVAAWRSLERRRERGAAALAPFDPSGALRKLVLDQDGGPTLGVLHWVGFIHLLGATGIHLYALTACLNRYLRPLAGFFGVPIRVARPFSRAASLLAWLGAWALTGFRAGMLRPWVVGCAQELARERGFRWHKFSPLVLALLADLVAALWRGHGLTDPGRWLYALAVGGAFTVRDSPLRFAIASWAFSGLWEAFRTGHLAVYTPLLSLVTVPWLALVLYPSACFVAWTGQVPPWTAPILELSRDGLHGLAAIALGSPGGLADNWLVPRGCLMGGAALAALATCLKPLADGVERRRLSVFAAALAVLIAFRLGFATGGAAIAPGDVDVAANEVEQLDIGQGDAALIRGAGPNDIGLIDAGPEVGLSDTAWLNLLAERRIDRISWVALTHLDADHWAGLRRLGELVPIGCVATAREQLETERGRSISRELASLRLVPREWEAACVPFPVLGPPPAERHRNNSAMSAVFIPLRGGGFYLSPGDAEAPDEPRIARWAAALAAGLAKGPRILKVGHHGSKTSSTPAFLARLQPSRAWISVGAGNSYGHPSASVLARLGALGIPVSRTDRDGALRAADVRRRPPARPP